MVKLPKQFKYSSGLLSHRLKGDTAVGSGGQTQDLPETEIEFASSGLIKVPAAFIFMSLTGRLN